MTLPDNRATATNPNLYLRRAERGQLLLHIHHRFLNSIALVDAMRALVDTMSEIRCKVYFSNITHLKHLSCFVKDWLYNIKELSSYSCLILWGSRLQQIFSAPRLPYRQLIGAVLLMRQCKRPVQELNILERTVNNMQIINQSVLFSAWTPEKSYQNVVLQNSNHEYG